MLRERGRLAICHFEAVPLACLFVCSTKLHFSEAFSSFSFSFEPNISTWYLRVGNLRLKEDIPRRHGFESSYFYLRLMSHFAIQILK